MTNLKFSLHLHNKDFNLSIKINFKNILTTEQKIASLLVIVLPAVILIIVTILALNPATSSMPLALIVIPIFIFLFGGGLTAGYFILKKPKKTIRNFEEINLNIKTTLQKINSYSKRGYFW